MYVETFIGMTFKKTINLIETVTNNYLQLDNNNKSKYNNLLMFVFNEIYLSCGLTL